MRALVVLLCMSIVTSEGKDPKVIIVGAGSSGIAAASKLLQNGITDVTILEAEGRFGGRVYSAKFGRTEEEPFIHRYYTSAGEAVMKQLGGDFFTFAIACSDDPTGAEKVKNGSFGEYVDNKINEYYGNHTEEITPDLRQGLTHAAKLAIMASEGAADLNDLSLKRTQEYVGARGYQAVNWKDRTYNTVLEILMKKIPNAEEELPIANKTLLNKQVTKIKYNGDGPIKITTSDGSEFTADHVISTISLGVLKADHEKIFEPALPEKNRNSIQGLGFGRNAKIFLYYDEPWWDTTEYAISLLIWTEADRKEIENDPEKIWMLGVGYSLPVEYKPKVLLLWMSGLYCEQMEKIPDELFENQTLELIERFFGKSHNLTQPKDIIRTRWNTNENFRGTYSYPSLASVANNASPEELGTPVTRNDRPVIQFAGEATEPDYYSTVHGAISSGWREADRLINFYKQQD
ncbi:spermine oxidase isoform X2 [Diachasma alloeum]|uniref:spermine oxidase isoform X2 n=1 Tax=Diachasma alloeum TaxID=454923 RepID=UPI0007383EDB|nr:spermine oxidase isoform X2 [Diachasma alloeum]